VRPQPLDASVVDQFRERWLRAIDELGASAAAEDAAAVFAQRMGCTVAEARLLVSRAWQMLGIRAPAGT
jgi:hypothetical protein